MLRRVTGWLVNYPLVQRTGLVHGTEHDSFSLSISPPIPDHIPDENFHLVKGISRRALFDLSTFFSL